MKCPVCGKRGYEEYARIVKPRKVTGLAFPKPVRAERHKGMGSRDRDEDLKRQRGYQDPSSYVRRDGSEKLVGKDWDKRVEELRLRCNGRCEYERPGTDLPRYCLRPGVDPDHRIKRSTRRDDRLENLQWLCRMHHDLKHPEFRPQWSKK